LLSYFSNYQKNNLNALSLQILFFRNLRNVKYLQNESNFNLDQNLLEFGPTKKHNLDQSITICIFPI